MEFRFFIWNKLSFPCINLSSLLGSALFGVIDVLLSGIFVLSIENVLLIYSKNITSLKDGGMKSNDKGSN